MSQYPTGAMTTNTSKPTVATDNIRSRPVPVIDNQQAATIASAKIRDGAPTVQSTCDR